MGDAILSISSKNYSSWSLRGWLLAKFSGLPFTENIISADDPSMRDELLLLSSSFLVPSLVHDGISVWDTLAIGEYLAEFKPALRSALPVNLQGDFPNFKVWKRAQADIDRITRIWRECLDLYGGPFLLGERSVADAMYAPVVTRFLTYHVKLDPVCDAYCKKIMAMPEMIEWVEAAKREPRQLEELEVELSCRRTEYNPELRDGDSNRVARESRPERGRPGARNLPAGTSQQSHFRAVRINLLP